MRSCHLGLVSEIGDWCAKRKTISPAGSVSHLSTPPAAKNSRVIALHYPSSWSPLVPPTSGFSSSHEGLSGFRASSSSWSGGEAKTRAQTSKHVFRLCPSCMAIDAWCSCCRFTHAWIQGLIDFMVPYPCCRDLSPGNETNAERFVWVFVQRRDQTLVFNPFFCFLVLLCARGKSSGHGARPRFGERMVFTQCFINC